jgi:hypothetical protein
MASAHILQRFNQPIQFFPDVEAHNRHGWLVPRHWLAQPGDVDILGVGTLRDFRLLFDPTLCIDIIDYFSQFFLLTISVPTSKDPQISRNPANEHTPHAARSSR